MTQTTLTGGPSTTVVNVRREGRDGVQMVRHVHAVLDDADFERVDETKDALDLAWDDFLIEATELLREKHGLDD